LVDQRDDVTTDLGDMGYEGVKWIYAI